MNAIRNMKKNSDDAASSRRAFKGMTLIECIIALLVVGVAGLIMVTAATTVSRLMLDTNHLNNKIDAEVPVANAQDTDALAADTNAAQSVTITVGKGDAANNTMSNTYQTYTVQKYSTKSIGAAAQNADTHMNGDLEFYVIEPTTQPTT